MSDIWLLDLPSHSSSCWTVQLFSNTKLLICLHARRRLILVHACRHCWWPRRNTQLLLHQAMCSQPC